MMIENKEPWNQSFAERYRKVIHNKHKKIVIYVYEKADTSTFRYRVYNVCQALDSSQDWVGAYFFEEELCLLDKMIPLMQLVVFSRVRYSTPVDLFFQQLKKRSITTVFDVDDLVFNMDKVPLLMESLAVKPTEDNYSYWFSYVARLWMMGQMCDYTISSNDFLCERLKDVFQKDSYVINNFLNHEQLKVSQYFLDNKPKPEFNQFKIGYFSGTPSHDKDFSQITHELAVFLDKYPNASLEVVGFINFPEGLKKYVDRKQIFHTPLVDFLTLQLKMSQVDVSIVPLVDNEFTNCKSELKYFEAAIVGTITCATPTHTFVKSIEHDKSGFLCREGDWLSTLEKIYKNKHDASIKENALSYCKSKYSPDYQCNLIENVFESLLSKKHIFNS